MRQHKRPYRYALNKRERPRDAKLFYGITENKKSANEHLTQTNCKDFFTAAEEYGTFYHAEKSCLACS